MYRRLPSLTALRSFEATARQLSFTRAAEELGVTQTAVSHQVKALEQDLSTQLFYRDTTRLRLTEAGSELFSVLRHALASISKATDRIRNVQGHTRLIVSLPAYLSAKWLTPRLGGFLSEAPDIELQLVHSSRPVDFAREEIHVAIRCGRGDWPRVGADLLFEREITPICSPKLHQSERLILGPDDLRHHTLLHEFDHSRWTEWLAFVHADLEPQHGLIVDDLNVLVHAAIDGMGVALVPAFLVKEDLEAGRVIAPLAHCRGPQISYFLLYPRETAKRSAICRFRDWIRREALPAMPTVPEINSSQRLTARSDLMSPPVVASDISHS